MLFMVMLLLVGNASAWTCDSCQNQTSEGAKFCGVCGQPSPTPAPVLTATPAPVLTAAPVAETASVPRAVDSTRIGSYVTFGHYEQDNDFDNGKEAIEWLVLDVQGGRTLLISRYALDCQVYNRRYTSVSWNDCSLRAWLNGPFMNNAFSAEEQSAILTTSVDNGSSQGYYSTGSGVNTQDKLFLLSYQEAWKYFKNSEARKCKPTVYAIAQNAWASSDGYCWWWLRSPGLSGSTACLVNYYGARFDYRVDQNFDGVRPAMWVDLSSGI